LEIILEPERVEKKGEGGGGTEKEGGAYPEKE